MTIESLDDKAKEDIGVTGLEMKDLTTIKRPDLRKGLITQRTTSSI